MEIATVIGNISTILLEPLKDVSRLVKKFKTPRDKSLPFSKLYKEDKELIELQQKLNNGRITKLSIRLLHCFEFIYFYHLPTLLPMY